MTKNIEVDLHALIEGMPEAKSGYRLLPIREGAINKNFRLLTNDKQYIVKLFAHNEYLPIDRDYTFELQKQLAEKGLAPKPCVLSHDRSIYIEEWIQTQDLPTNQEIQVLAAHLAKIHETEIEIETLCLRDHWSFYMKKLPADTFLQTEYKNTLKAWDKYSMAMQSDFVLCHHDLHIQHISGDRNICFDWEYAGKNCRFFDIACAILINELNSLAARQLVLEYAIVTNIPLYEIEYNVKSALEFAKFTNKLWLLATKQADE